MKTAIACTAISGLCFYLSGGMELFWALQWLAPIPVLWYAFVHGAAWRSALVAVSACALGELYFVQIYTSVFPVGLLAAALIVPALGFAGAVLGARLVAKTLGAIPAALAFAGLWTTFDYLLSLGPDGTALSPAYAQVAAPLLIQMSSLFGLWVITFLLGLVSAGLAAGLAKKQWRAAVLALAVFGLNAGYGAWRLSSMPVTEALAVGLIADDRTADAAFSEDPNVAGAALEPYEAVTRDLALAGARFVVWPEKIAVLASDVALAWRERAQALSDETGAVIVMGVDEHGDVRRNRAYAFVPGGAEPFLYDKRHLVQGLEAAFAVGEAPLSFAPGLGVVICKDMDFPTTLRADAASGAIEVMFVPAWDFDGDAWLHARMAILRGVEGGFAVARTAKQGLLTLTDAYGRQIDRAQSTRDGIVTVSANLPRGPGPTLYTRIGDMFAWGAAALALVLVGWALTPPPRAARR
jgi:apolipoprotein N-acyltransferase